VRTGADISLKGDEFGALLRHVYKFWGRAAAGSGKAGDPILHHIKNRSDATDDFKN
jgi:hypothetical protein